MAQSNLGFMLANSLGVPQDFTESAKWYGLAAEQGDVSAQINLGIGYDLGRGGLQDDIMEHMWYNVASANGAKNAGSYRDETEAKMTSNEIKKAQEMAQECLKSNYKKCGY